MHLLLLYGFLSIYAIGVVIIFISKTPQNNPQHLYYAAKPPEPVIQKESSEESLRVVERKRICNWIEGCATFTNAKTQKNIALLVSGF